MKKIFIALMALVILSVPSFALEADYIPLTYTFPVATVSAGSDVTSVHAFKAPANITIKNIYVTETDGVVASSTDYATFSLTDDGTAIQAFSTTTALTAMTPAAFTIVNASDLDQIAEDSIVTVVVTQVGTTGVALTTPVVQLDYTIGW